MTAQTLLDLLSDQQEFATRHNGPDPAQQQVMLETIGATSLDQLIRPDRTRCNPPTRESELSQSHRVNRLCWRR